MLKLKIYLIRHGETTGDIEDRYGGNYDDNLSENGIKQAKELGKKLVERDIQVVFHSPKLRAKETARIVNKFLKAKLVVADDLRERNNYGILTGLVKSEAKQKFPREVGEWEKKGFLHRVKGSENYLHFKKRVTKAFEKIANSNEYETIAIISHGGPISCIVRETLKLGELKTLGNCAILRINKNGKKLVLERLENAELEKKQEND